MKLVDFRSEVQRIVLRTDPPYGLVLELDGFPQFTESSEHVYHECLAVVPLLFGSPERVFIAGGGDGLAASRLLRCNSIEAIVLCDYDAAVTRLALEQEDLLALNKRSLLDPRVRVVNEDAFAYLEGSVETYDLIICDFPDPWFAELNRVYSREFYGIVRDRLAPDGIVAVQTLSDPPVARMIRSTLADIFPDVRFYRCIQNLGFTLASGGSLDRVNAVPEWTRFLNEETVTALFSLPKDVAREISAPVDAINTIENQRLLKVALTTATRPRFEYRHPENPTISVLRLDEYFDFGPQETEALFDAMREETSPPLVELPEERGIGYELRLIESGYERTKTRRRLRYRFDSAADDAMRAAWASYGSASRVARIDSLTCRPSENGPLAALLRRHFEDENGRDGFDLAAVLEARGKFLLVSDGEGSPIAALKWRVTAANYPEIDIASFTGSPTERLATLLTTLAFLRASLTYPFIDFVMDESAEALVRQLPGVEDWGSYRLFAPASIEPDAIAARSARASVAYRQRIFQWHCATFFPLNERLSAEERAYVEACFALSTEPLRAHRYFSNITYSHRVVGETVNSSRFGIGSVTHDEEVLAAARPVLDARGIDLRELFPDIDRCAFYGFAWDFEQGHFKVYVRHPSLQDIASPFRELLASVDAAYRPEGLLSTTLCDGEVLERKVYAYPAHEASGDLPPGTSQRALMSTTRRGLVSQYDVATPDDWIERINDVGRAIAARYRTIGEVLDTIAFTDRDHYTLYFPSSSRDR